MDALILSCGTGGGHHAAAAALQEEMERRGHRSVRMNPYDLKSNRLSGVIDKAYIKTVQAAPGAFGAVYRLGNWYRTLPFRSPVYFANHAMAAAMGEYLAAHPVDVVLMTHLFPAEILTGMRRRGQPLPKTVFVSTDYVCTPFTEETACDAYITPAADLNDEYVRRGIPREKLHAFGIPTRRAFSQTVTKAAVRQQLGLQPDGRYILVTGGSMGGGRLQRAIEQLAAYFTHYADTALLVVCGSNTALYERLRQQNLPRVTVMGHTDAMALYIQASDLFITKPGGLSSTEAAVCGVPLWHTGAIPGCESCNARYFSERGMSLSGDVTPAMLHAAWRLLEDTAEQQAMQANQQQYINPAAAAAICDLAEDMAGTVATYSCG